MKQDLNKILEELN